MSAPSLHRESTDSDMEVKYKPYYCVGGQSDDGLTDELFECVYTNFVEEVDAVDNGISDKDGAAR